MILGFLALAVLFLAAASLPINSAASRIVVVSAAMLCAAISVLAAFGLVNA